MNYYYYYWQNADLRHVLLQTLTLRHVQGIFFSFEVEIPLKSSSPPVKNYQKIPRQL